LEFRRVLFRSGSGPSYVLALERRRIRVLKEWQEEAVTQQCLLRDDYDNSELCNHDRWDPERGPRRAPAGSTGSNRRGYYSGRKPVCPGEFHNQPHESTTSD